MNNINAIFLDVDGNNCDTYFDYGKKTKTATRYTVKMETLDLFITIEECI